MSRAKGIEKSVQGAWLSDEDRKLLESEAKRIGLRSSTALASSILTEYCHNKRIELAEQVIKDSKRRGRNGKKVKENSL